jgi:ribulose-phosphate 3-epimerase
MVHVDVMDGVFCPMTTVGPPIVQALPSRFIKDVHLMVHQPLDKVDQYVEAGADVVTVHVEATNTPERVLDRLTGTGVVRGIAINPGTPVAAVQPLLGQIDLVLVLAVTPGVSGQTFSSATDARLDQVRSLIDDREIVLAVDGGITDANVADVAALRPDVIVSGSAIFRAGTPRETARSMARALAAAP